MQNDISEIDKNQITTRLGRGKKRKIAIDRPALFKQAGCSHRTAERFETWLEYSEKLEQNLTTLHQKMCKKVFDDIIGHLEQTNEMLDVERMAGNDLVQLLPVLCLNTGINLPGKKNFKNSNIKKESFEQK